MNKIILLAFTALFLTFGCAESEDKTESKQEILDQETPISDKEPDGNKVGNTNNTEKKDKPTLHDGEVTLNNGAKWKADAQTTALVKEIKDKLAIYRADINFDRNTAVRELKVYVQKLISSYKQKGDSQIQFFNWTTKYMRSIVVLSEANTPEQINNALDLLNEDMERYSSNFK